MSKATFALILFFQVTKLVAATNVLVARLISKNGKVESFHDGGKLEGNSDDILWGGIIKTGPSSNAQIVVMPNLVIAVASNSRVKFVGSVVEENGKKILASSAIQVLAGQVLGSLKNGESRTQEVRVIGPRSISSVRGTVFIAAANDRDSALFVKEGTVFVQGVGATDGKDVGSDQGVIVGDDNQIMPVSSPDVGDIFTKALGRAKVIEPSQVSKIWSETGSRQIAEHAPIASQLKGRLQLDITSILDGLRKDIAGVNKDLKKDAKGMGNWLRSQGD